MRGPARKSLLGKRVIGADEEKRGDGACKKLHIFGSGPQITSHQGRKRFALLGWVKGSLSCRSAALNSPSYLPPRMIFAIVPSCIFEVPS